MLELLSRVFLVCSHLSGIDAELLLSLFSQARSKVTMMSPTGPSASMDHSQSFMKVHATERFSALLTYGLPTRFRRSEVLY